MRTRIVIAAAWLLAILSVGTPAIAQTQPAAPSGVINMHERDLSEEIERLHLSAVATAKSLGLPAARVQPPQVVRQPNLAFPLRSRSHNRAASPYSIWNFVDLDPSAGLKDFACGQRTYDGHNGIDMVITPFWWTQMDQGEVEVVAAAPGTIVQKADGNSDRQCPPAPANYVVIAQDDGVYAYYYHLKKASVTAKAVGQRVSTNEFLALVGNSGNSAWPHLHFELRDATSKVIDPFSGTCNAPGLTVWKHQWPGENDTRPIAISTSNAAPVRTYNCTPTITDTPNYSDTFQPGSTVYVVVTIRDNKPGDTGSVQIFRPDGSLAFTGSLGVVGELYQDALWWWTYSLPGGAPTGVWRARATVNGKVIEHGFFVGTNSPAAQLFGAVLPGGRSVQTSQPATLFATMMNASPNPAHGCWIHPETPLGADFSFQTTDPKTNQLIGSPNTVTSIPANSAQTFLIAFQPLPGAVAEAWSTRLRFKCTNADAAPIFNGVNTALLSMSPNPVPDVIPIAVTPSQDGVVRLPSNSGTQVMATAAINIGQSAVLTTRPTITGGAAATATICKTDDQGQCEAPPSAAVSIAFNENDVNTFTVFVTATGAIQFDPANKRVRLDFVDVGEVVRGQTSAALATQ